MSSRQLRDVGYGAQRLGIDEARFYGLVREKLLPAGVIVHLGRQIRVDPEKLEEFISAGGAALPGGWKRQAKTVQPHSYASSGEELVQSND